ncbi:hypothetical protein GWI33_019843 [Rhynchophorus ferrugineus]|uniref:Uncharacterized protein n=1 Tax=Rhynchophorus ferrugineus TaxID=354439 RepID=A0A834HTP3_RHYFE|nr:hypothetical protein GWI33_019843 [Rhynchophorus ferrugineus]
MSRKSENSKAGSEGDGDSVFSSYPDSPRKTSGLISGGPFGDHSLESKTVNQLGMNTDVSSSVSDDQEIYDLKMEYLERLQLIREKLANMDIADYDAYYKNPYWCNTGCQITEITDDHVDITPENDPDEEPNSEELTVLNSNEEKCPEFVDKAKPILKTIFQYGDQFNLDSSSTELLDLNYNPPKKKRCFREVTPKIHTASSDGDFNSADKECPKSKEDENTKEENRQNNPTKQNATVVQENNLNDVIEDNTILKDKSTPDSCQVILHKDLLGLQNSSVTIEEQYFESPASISGSSRKSSTKNRKIYLRSARNKINPMEKITLYDEIRTTEAMKRTKRESSSSTNDSFFRDVMIKTETNREPPDIRSIGSFDVAPKKSPNKISSLTRISNFCSALFRRNSTSLEEEPDQVENRSNKTSDPRQANAILNLRKNQECVHIYEPSDTTEDDVRSVYTDFNEDEYYNFFCPVCFCF